MRARLTMKLVSVTVMLILSVLGARACQSSSPSSPANPANVLSNGMAGVCANQQATADASGDPAPGDSATTGGNQTALSQLEASAPGAAGALRALTAGGLSCPTTTVANGS